jgi:hypothetical protein
VKGNLATYYCNVIKHPPCISNVIPLREKGKPLNWCYQQDMKCFLTSTDIQVIRDFGGEVKILPMIENEDFRNELEKHPFEFRKKDKHESIIGSLEELAYEKEKKEAEEDFKKLYTAVGFYWNKRSYCFKELIDILSSIKIEEDRKKNLGLPYNAALREMAKLAMNSLSGKVGQNLFLTETKLCCDVNSQTKFMSTHSKVEITPFNKADGFFMKGDSKDMNFMKNRKPWHISAFIYSYSREHMYRSMISQLPGKWYATDTDSIHVNMKDFNLKDEGDFEDSELRYGKFHRGNRMGQFQPELTWKTLRAYYVMCKCYAYFGAYSQIDPETGKFFQKKKFKGIAKNDKCITNEVLKKHCNLQYIPEPEEYTKDGEQKRNKAFIKFNKAFSKLPEDIKFKIYEESPLIFGEELYMELTSMIEYETLEKKKYNYKILVLSSRLEKRLGLEKIAHISQSYIIKSISPSGIYF